MSELPEGWTWASIEELGEVVTGSTPPKKNPDFFGSDIPFYKPTDLDAGYNVVKAREYLSNIGATKSRLLPPRAVLVTCIGATIGKTGLTQRTCATNQQINAVIPVKELVSPYWLYRTITSPFMQRAIIENSSSTTLPILNKSRFSKLTIPLPPLNEQHRIVAKLDRLFARSRSAREELARVSGLCDRYKQAILTAAFRGDLTADCRGKMQLAWSEKSKNEFQREAIENRKLLRGSRLAVEHTISKQEILGSLPESWLCGRLIDIADIKTGFAFKSTDFQKSGIRLVRGINVAPGKIDWTETVCLSVEMASEYGDYTIEEGDILVAMDRPLISNGLKLTCVTSSDIPSILVQRVARIRPRKWTQISYLLHLLNSSIFIDHAIARSTGSDLPHISGNDIALTPIPIPPLAEQIEIGNMLEKMLPMSKVIESELNHASKLLDRLDQATLAKAFRGELVPQDPNDEPASALLERILAERQNQTPAKRASTKKAK